MITPGEMEFCESYQRTGSKIRAWWKLCRHDGTIPSDNPGACTKAAEAILARPDIQEYLEAQAAAKRARLPKIHTAHEALRQFVTLAGADVRELVEYRRGCCRFCWGMDGRRQWTSAEYMDELDRVELANKTARIPEPYPPIAGGLGFDKTRSANPACAECNGEGEGRVIIHDTSTLSEAGKMLYRGVKVTKNGVEVVMADPQKAAEAAARVIGAFKDSLAINDGRSAEAANRVLAAQNAADAGRAYADLMDVEPDAIDDPGA